MEGAEENGGGKTTKKTKKTTKTTTTARGGSASSLAADVVDVDDPMVSPAAAADYDVNDVHVAVELDDDDYDVDVVHGAVELDDHDDHDDGLDDESRVRRRRDEAMMGEAVSMVVSTPGGERAPRGPYPEPVCGALLVAEDGRVLGRGLSDYTRHAVEYALLDAGVSFAPLNEWFVVDWSSDSDFRRDVGASTMYVTLEPSDERRGEERPPITQLIEMANIPRIVIGCQDPVPEYAARGAGSLHASGVSVTMGVMREECERLISGYATLANSKIHRMARRHMQRFGRPMGHLHCSVIDSDDAEAFIRNGNSFGKNFGGKILSYRDFGAYEIAPPPESIWASGEGSGVDDVFEPDADDYFFNNMDFEDEDAQENLGKNPMMPWYEQVDACSCPCAILAVFLRSVATFPKSGNGPVDDNSIQGRLTGLKWLATDGKSLPAGVERILVMDATDLQDLPLSNDDPNLPVGVDVEEFWKADGRKPSRILLRHGDNAVAIAVAKAAAKAAAAAAEAAAKAKAAIETGDAELAAEAALECQEAAMASNKFIQNELQKTQDLKKRLVKLGVKVEIIKGGGNPVDVMEHLGKRSGYNSVVWRAGE
ncbi:hypothetical protein ACHAW5_003818 [Stephanodiscus triporus]|uniref:CMP/dCMP-type deaminase domain-containing protein n=1 Tax=Stephanodiscus triporus TaxID=2934178 RepID=A0ABD3QZT5_9STRA